MDAQNQTRDDDAARDHIEIDGFAAVRELAFDDGDDEVTHPQYGQLRITASGRPCTALFMRRAAGWSYALYDAQGRVIPAASDEPEVATVDVALVWALYDALTWARDPDCHEPAGRALVGALP